MPRTAILVRCWRWLCPAAAVTRHPRRSVRSRRDPRRRTSRRRPVPRRGRPSRRTACSRPRPPCPMGFGSLTAPARTASCSGGARTTRAVPRCSPTTSCTRTPRSVLREVRDGVPDCDLDMVADFVARSLRVADSDGDSLAGVSFAYRRNCARDVGPAVQQLLVLEGGEKYILRGSSFSQFTVFQDPEADPSQDSWPGSACNDELERFRGFAVQ